MATPWAHGTRRSGSWVRSPFSCPPWMHTVATDPMYNDPSFVESLAGSLIGKRGRHGLPTTCLPNPRMHHPPHPLLCSAWGVSVAPRGVPQQPCSLHSKSRGSYRCCQPPHSDLSHSARGRHCCATPCGGCWSGLSAVHCRCAPCVFACDHCSHCELRCPTCGCLWVSVCVCVGMFG